jgi:hypothetical protein
LIEREGLFLLPDKRIGVVFAKAEKKRPFGRQFFDLLLIVESLYFTFVPAIAYFDYVLAASTTTSALSRFQGHPSG